MLRYLINILSGDCMVESLADCEWVLTAPILVTEMTYINHEVGVFDSSVTDFYKKCRARGHMQLDEVFGHLSL